MQTPPPIESHETEVLTVSKGGDGGHRVLKLLSEGEPIVLKCYGLKTSRLRTFLRELGCLAIVGKSSIRAGARFKTEREVLELWRREGFDVPRVLSAEPPATIHGPCLTLEWIPGRNFSHLLRCAETSLDRKRELIERFAAVLGKRHERALSLQETRLIFEHPTLDHVLVWGDRLVHFDFEIVFARTKDVERLLRREIAGFLRSLSKSSGENFPTLLKIFTETYPDSSRLAQVLEELRRYGSVPALDWLKLFYKMSRKLKRYRKRSSLVLALEKVL